MKTPARKKNSPISYLVRKRKYRVKNIQNYLLRDSSCINIEDTRHDSHLVDILKDEKCSADIIRLVLEFGADINVGCLSNGASLIVALEASRDEDVIKLLLDNGADVDVPDSPLPLMCIALRHGASKGVIQLLLDKGCPLEECPDHDTILHCFTQNSPRSLQGDVLHLLIEKGADVAAVDRYGQSVLCFALKLAAKDHDVELLLSAGVSMTSCTQHPSALLCATKQRGMLTAGIVKLLLERGALPSQMDQFGRTPLERALWLCSYETEAIKVLLDWRDPEGNYTGMNNSKNLLNLASMNRRCKPSVVKLLIARGCAISGEDNRGVTALHLAAFHQRKTGCIKVLMKEGANIHAKCNSGKRTPLNFAWESCTSPAIIRELLEAGSIIKKCKKNFLLGEHLELMFMLRRERRGLYNKDNTVYNYLYLLIKYYLIQKPKFDFQRFVARHDTYEEFSKFAEDCALELQKMESVLVGCDRTLREFLAVKSADKREALPYNFDSVLENIVNNEFPLFLEIIPVKIGRKKMLEVLLPQVHVHSRRRVPLVVGREENSELNYDCLYIIVQHLTNVDLLHLIAAFNFTSDPNFQAGDRNGQASDRNGQASDRNGQASENKMPGIKRSFGMSSRYPKRQKKSSKCDK